MRISVLTRKWLLLALSVGAFFPFSSDQETFHERVFPSPHLNLLVVDVVQAYAPYIDFCRRNPTECDMTGPEVLAFDTSVEQALRLVNKDVNKGIVFALDQDQYGVEEYWDYPRTGKGDCEDIALEKRARLVRKGFPRSTLRLAIVVHWEHLSSHCILTVETTAGTYVLDSFSDVVSVWYDAPYNFESRERNDGQWERFDQGVWYSGTNE